MTFSRVILLRSRTGTLANRFSLFRRPFVAHHSFFRSFSSDKSGGKLEKFRTQDEYKKILGIDESVIGKSDTSARNYFEEQSTDIRRAYNKQILKCHPDLFEGKPSSERLTATRQFTLVREAFQMLSAPTAEYKEWLQKRERRRLKEEKRKQQSGNRSDGRRKAAKSGTGANDGSSPIYAWTSEMRSGASKHSESEVEFGGDSEHFEVGVNASWGGAQSPQTANIFNEHSSAGRSAQSQHSSERQSESGHSKDGAKAHGSAQKTVLKVSLFQKVLLALNAIYGKYLSVMPNWFNIGVALFVAYLHIHFIYLALFHRERVFGLNSKTLPDNVLLAEDGTDSGLWKKSATGSGSHAPSSVSSKDTHGPVYIGLQPYFRGQRPQRGKEMADVIPAALLQKVESAQNSASDSDSIESMAGDLLPLTMSDVCADSSAVCSVRSLRKDPLLWFENESKIDRRKRIEERKAEIRRMASERRETGSQSEEPSASGRVEPKLDFDSIPESIRKNPVSVARVNAYLRKHKCFLTLETSAGEKVTEVNSGNSLNIDWNGMAQSLT